MNVLKLAQRFSPYFEQATRVDGVSYTRLQDDRPGVLHDLVYKVHKQLDMLPDDFMYATIEEAIDAIAEDGYVELSDFNIVPDSEDSELLAWVGSQGRVSYVDEVLYELGIMGNCMFTALLQAGQIREKEEIYRLVLQGLQEIADSDVEQGAE